MQLSNSLKKFALFDALLQWKIAKASKIFQSLW
jgi:hypothetical protein